MQLFYAIISGIFVSVLSYLTVGPINMAIIQTTLNEGRRNGLMIGIGSAFIDTLFCFIALFGYRFVESNPHFLNIFHLITIPILFYLGIKSIRHRNRTSVFKKKARGHNFLFLGMVICFSNPVLFAYWLYVTTYLQSQQWLGHTTLDYVAFSIGVLTGIVGFIYLLVMVVSFTNRLIPQRWFSIINVIIGLFFIGFGLYLLADYIITRLIF